MIEKYFLIDSGLCHFDRKNFFQQILEWRNLALQTKRQDFATILGTMTSIAKLKNIEWIVMNGGKISLGRIGPASCAATACDEAQGLAMLVRRSNESLGDLLQRLDTAIEDALENNVFADEING